MSHPTESTQTRLVKGLLAGLIAGLVATAAKTLAERFYPSQPRGEEDLSAQLAEKVAGHPLDDSTKDLASGAIHWGFGALTGAAYGALAEFYPAATSKEGASFGLALMTLTQEGAVPALGLTEQHDKSLRQMGTDAATHVLYGVVTERVRSIVRKIL